MLKPNNPNSLERRLLSGKVGKFPKELQQFQRDLEIGDQFNLAVWWQVIHQEDKQTVVSFLKNTWDFFSTRIPEIKMLSDDWIPYCALFAIGSTTREEENYSDVDFLLITNLIYREMDYLDPQEILRKQFDYCISPTIPEAYRGHDTGGKRSVITLTPKEGLAKRIHLTLQPEISNVEYWKEEDKESKVLIYNTDRQTKIPAKVL